MVSMWQRLRSSLSGACLLVCWAVAALGQEALDPADASLQTIVEPHAGRPLEGEMIRVTIRGSYSVRLRITLNALAQPELPNVTWMQVTRDAWRRETVDGKQMQIFERRLALFPRQAGRVEIGAFRHQLTLATADGKRVVQEVRSAPVTLETAPRPSTESWWMPASELRLTDEWDRRPDRLGREEIARRTVTLEAVALPAQLLPPQPKLRASNVIMFSDPEERTTKFTQDGPVSQVVWRWTVRPASSAPARVEAYTIPWFDTVARQVREAELAPSSVAFADAVSAEAGSGASTVAAGAYAGFIGVGIGILAGLMTLLSGSRLRGRHDLRQVLTRWLPDSDLAGMKAAAKRRDLHVMRSCAHRFAMRAGREWYPPPPVLQRCLSELDRYVFGSPSVGSTFDTEAFLGGYLRAVAEWKSVSRLGKAPRVQK
ncbi:hypothetical protein ACUN0C_14660 [Faunimonas sp. B44]|uniref:hypothetical protein n=1 Tax=Faunimonas sp. B44 TaxID=3461493 RepID=UPI004044F4AD